MRASVGVQGFQASSPMECQQLVLKVCRYKGRKSTQPISLMH